MHSLEDWPCLTGVLLLPLHVVFAYWIEALCKPPHPKFSQPVVTLLHVLNLSACIVIPLHRVCTLLILIFFPCSVECGGVLV